MGHPKGSRVVTLDSTGMISYLSLIVLEAVSCTVSEISSICPTSLYLATSFAFNHLRRGFHGMISVKICTEVRGWLGYKTA